MKTYQWLVSAVFFAGVAAVSGCKKQPAVDGGSSTVTATSGYQFENGYPRRETAEKLYDEMDYQRATQAYLWALPAVGYKALYDAQSKTFGAANGDVVFYRDLKDKAGMLTPNITTLYAFSFWDLAKQGPMVVDKRITHFRKGEAAQLGYCFVG